MRDYKNKCNKIDDFNTECIWLLIVEKDDNDYDEILKHFDEYDEFFTNQIIAAIRMAKNGYIEKSKDTSHTYIFLMNNGDISVINHEQLLQTNAYNRLYTEAVYHITNSIRTENDADMRSRIIEYLDYMEQFINDNHPHLYT